jgi:hypothetical protein
MDKRIPGAPVRDPKDEDSKNRRKPASFALVVGPLETEKFVKNKKSADSRAAAPRSRFS